MQGFQLFILESQAARKRLREIFEFPDGCRSHLEHNGLVQSCDVQPASLLRPWKRWGRISTKRVCAAMAVIGIAAIGALCYASSEGNENKPRARRTQPAAAVPGF